MVNIKVISAKNKRKMAVALANSDSVEKLMVKIDDVSGDAKGYSCKQCNKKLKSKGGMENHITKTHLKQSDGEADIGTVEKKSYNLNVLNALENKLQFLDRKYDLCVDEERGAKTGENVMLLAKTAFFEYLKLHLGEELQQKFGIMLKQERIVFANADHLPFGQATVEFQGSAKFTVQNHEYEVKLIFYATKCDIMVQQKGEACRRWPHLSGGTPSQYFANSILMPLSEKISEEKPDINNAIPKLMRMNLKKMKESLKKVKISKVVEKKKCVTCSVNCVPNSGAKATRKCENCGNYEHDKCYDPQGSKAALILAGKLEFNCTRCCIQNPNFVTNKPLKTNQVYLSILSFAPFTFLPS